MSGRIRLVKRCCGLSCIFLIVACRPPFVGERMTSFDLRASDGSVHSLPPGAEGAPLTVLVFSAWHCPCQAAHDARLVDLFGRYHARGVDFYAVDSEVGGSLADDAAQAKAHGYAFPVLRDEGARVARALRADFATESFVIDRQGVVRYHGGLDSDRKDLHDDAVPLLENALDDLLQGRAPRAAETKALGCALQTW
jgi:peroxiredoxin